MIGIEVVKRDGHKEPFSMDKIIKMYNFCRQGLNIDDEQFWKEFRFTLKSGITTKEIQQNLIATANKLSISDKGRIKDYSILAGRFYLLDWIKDIRLHREREYDTFTDDYGFFQDANDWIFHLKKYIELGIYDERILKISNDILEELYEYAKKVQLDYNYNFPYFMWNDFYYQVVKFSKSYILTYNNKPVETFAEALLLISILGFLPDYKQNKELFMNNVKKFYKLLLDRVIIPATPQLSNLRRAKGNLSSCNILDIHDNLESIMYSFWQVAEISKRGGGLGIYLGEVRPNGSYIQGNKGKSVSVLKWCKILDDMLDTIDQLGKRKGAGTVALPIWHMDILDFMAMRNPIGEIRMKMFSLYPQVVVPDLFMERVKENKDWTLIDHYELKMKCGIDLVNCWGKEFEENYTKAEELVKQGKIRGKVYKVREIYRQLIKNILASGMPYIFFVDTVNQYSPFKEQIKCGNLCVESYSPFSNSNPEGKKPDEKIEDLGYVHSCNLLSLNLPVLYELGYLQDNQKLSSLMRLVVRYMDNILDIAGHPIYEIKKHNQDYRTLGIGFVGLADLLIRKSIDDNKLYAYRLTSRNVNKDELFNLLKQIFGRIAFYSIRASVDLAKEKGRTNKYSETKWNEVLLGQIPYGEGFEVSPVVEFDVDRGEVDELIEDIQKYGIRNTMLLNAPPNTSTSIYAGTTASIFPPFNLIQTEKQSTGVYVVFPRYITEGWFYYDEYSKFNEQDLYDVIEIVSFIQKYIDSGISFDYPVNIRDGFIPKEEVGRILGQFIYKAWKSGIKALYYARIVAKAEGEQAKEECVSCAN